ncbi:MAG: J domain-containing protein [Bacteroidota bacterium]
MNHDRDYYAILELEPTAHPRQIRAAYQRLAAKLKPLLKDNPIAQEDFKAIYEAWEILGNPKLRRRYDEMREQQALAQNTLDLMELERTSYYAQLFSSHSMTEQGYDRGRFGLASVLFRLLTAYFRSFEPVVVYLFLAQLMFGLSLILMYPKEEWLTALGGLLIFHGIFIDLLLWLFLWSSQIPRAAAPLRVRFWTAWALLRRYQRWLIVVFLVGEVVLLAMMGMKMTEGFGGWVILYPFLAGLVFYFGMLFHPWPEEEFSGDWE